MNVTIEFTRDFATKKKGEIVEYDSQFASRLINEGVAKQSKKVVEDKPKRVRRTKEEIEADKNSK